LQTDREGAPSSPEDLFEFIEEVDAVFLCAPEAPMLVHCSAGVGRTGIAALPTGMMFLKHCVSSRTLRYIYIHMSVWFYRPITLNIAGTFCLALAVQRCLSAGAVGWEKVMDMVMQMRSSRRHMVQTIDQYRFCYAAVLFAAERQLGLVQTYI
jgi:protein tyrosine phosphatase